MNENRPTADRLAQAAVSGEQALALARALGSLDLLPYIINDLGDVYATLGELSGTGAVAEGPRPVRYELGNEPMLRADSLTGGGAWSGMSGDYDHALAYLDMAISQRINNIWGKAYSRGIHGWMFFAGAIGAGHG